MGLGRVRAAGVMLIAAGLLWGCSAPEPLGPDATAEELHDACEAGDLDACSVAAHRRDAQHEAAMSVN